jgi:ABC-type antimicrobial peptide transport system permease subunit
VLSVNRDIPVLGDGLWTGFGTMDAFLSVSLAPRRFTTTLLVAFAVSAIFLAIVGLYGVLAYQIGQRRHEIAIRMALGAPRELVIRGVLIRGLQLVSIGIILGVTAAYFGARLLASLVYGVGVADPTTFLIAAVVVAIVAMAATSIPALGITRLDPLTALRYE